jgi:hypothetical protein
MVDLESRYLRNFKKTGEVLPKIIFSFPGGFFYSMVSHKILYILIFFLLVILSLASRI